jgi:hypothetical protein
MGEAGPRLRKSDEMAIELEATITCPQCGFARQEQMPPDT